MNRRNGHHVRARGRNSRSAFGPDSAGEIQAASLSSPFFRAAWSTGSTMTWQQFVDRWESRFAAPHGADDRGDAPSR